jgi:hypothetical protein
VQHGASSNVAANLNFVMETSATNQYVWCFCMERCRHQLCQISDTCAKLGGYENADALQRVLKEIAIRGIQSGDDSGTSAERCAREDNRAWRRVSNI